jgi:hypothetical protein
MKAIVLRSYGSAEVLQYEEVKNGKFNLSSYL